MRSGPAPYPTGNCSPVPIVVLVAPAPDAVATITENVHLERPDTEQDVLVETPDAWRTYAGSATGSGARLFCHPNTVHCRPHKRTELTGRPTNVRSPSLTDCHGHQTNRDDSAVRPRPTVEAADDMHPTRSHTVKMVDPNCATRRSYCATSGRRLR